MTDREITALLEALFDFGCGRRVGELVDADELLAAVDAASAAPRIAGLLARLAVPARARLLAALAGSARRLQAWLPAPTREAIAALLGAPVRIPEEWAVEAVRSKRVRAELRAVLEESLRELADDLAGLFPGGRGMLGILGRGRGLLEAVQERVGDLVGAATGRLERRLVRQLTSERTARWLGERRRRAFRDLVGRTENDAAGLLARVPWGALDELVAPIFAHNLARAEVRALIRAELAAALAELDRQTIGELLDELGLREMARRAWLRRALPLARAFLERR